MQPKQGSESFFLECNSGCLGCVKLLCTPNLPNSVWSNIPQNSPSKRKYNSGRKLSHSIISWRKMRVKFLLYSHFLAQSSSHCNGSHLSHKFSQLKKTSFEEGKLSRRTNGPTPIIYTTKQKQVCPFIVHYYYYYWVITNHSCIFLTGLLAKLYVLLNNMLFFV